MTNLDVLIVSFVPKGTSFEATWYDEDCCDFGHSLYIRKFPLQSLEDVHTFINFYKKSYGSSCIVFSFVALLGSCTSLHGTADGKSVIVRNDTVVVNYGGSVSKSF